VARRDEILQAIYEADRLHAKYDTKSAVARGAGRIDVFRMLVDRDIYVMFKPLKNLLGAYFSDPDTGVLVTTKRPLPVQRFTAAHELGHAALGHEVSLDDLEILERPIFAADASGDPREDQANAFAAQLLTPQWLIVHHMKQQGWRRDSFNEPATAYQLALRMGSSYSSTCYALAECNAIDRPVRDKLLQVKPKMIKQSLVRTHEPKHWYGDVWIVTERDNGLVLEGSRSDLVVLKFLEHSGSGYVWQFGDLVDAGMAIVEDGRASVASDQHIGGVVFRTVVAEPQAEAGASGHVNLREVRPWQPKGVPLHSLELDLDLTGPVPKGPHPIQREADLLEVA
jgi:Zn-dependent peptidase ImmA (M78 family)